jgi:hypothetical protein
METPNKNLENDDEGERIVETMNIIENHIKKQPQKNSNNNLNVNQITNCADYYMGVDLGPLKKMWREGKLDL